MAIADVFVSYSHRDKDWVRDVLVPKLEDRGFKVLIDYRDFTTGSIGAIEMQQAVENTRRTILVLTPEYVGSAWSTFENAMAQSLDPDARWRKVIPLMREDCTMPLRIRILHYRDLRRDDAGEWERLFRDLI